MTLIVVMIHWGCPIVLVDVLLTVGEATEEPFALPTTPNVNQALKKVIDLKVVGRRCIASRTDSIGWSP